MKNTDFLLHWFDQEKVRIWILHFLPSYFLPVPNKWIFSVFTDLQVIHEKGMRDFLQKYLIEFYRKGSHFLDSNQQNTPCNDVSTSNFQHFFVDIYWVASNLLIVVSKWWLQNTWTQTQRHNSESVAGKCK